MTDPKDFMPRDGHYLYPEFADAVEQAIIKNFVEITALVMAGTPPVMALIPDLNGLIHKATYWRLADRCIGYALGPRFERVGRVKVPIALFKRATIYAVSKHP